MTSRRVVACLIAVTALALAPALWGTLFWDDDALLPPDDAPLVDLARRAFTRGFWEQDALFSHAAHRYWRPLPTLLFGLARHGHLSPGAMHALVIALHLAAVWAASRCARRWFHDDPWRVGVATGAFALHATRFQSVGWISGVTDVLMALPALGALALASRPTSRRTVAGVAALTALSLLGKETAAALPLAVAVTSWATSRDANTPAPRAPALASLGALVAYAALRITAMRPHPSPPPSPWWRHAAIVGETVARQCLTAVWPWPQRFLRIAVDVTDVDTVRVLPEWTLAGAALLTLLAVVAWRGRATPMRTLGIALAALFAAPTWNIAWLGLEELTADRFLYLPMFGVGVALAAVRPRDARAPTAALVALALAHAATLATSCARLDDPYALWRDELRDTPRSTVAALNLAGEEFGRGAVGRAWSILRQVPGLAGGPRDRARLRAMSEPEAFMAAVLLTPDHQRETLSAAVAALEALRRGGVASRVRFGRVTHDLAPSERHTAAVGWTLAQVEAAARSRLGDHDRALEMLTALCRRGRCSRIAADAALVAARARRWSLAAQWLSRMGDAPSRQALAARLRAARTLAARSAASPEAAVWREAEVDLTLELPEAARARLATVPDSVTARALAVEVAVREDRLDDATRLRDALGAAVTPSLQSRWNALAMARHAMRAGAEAMWEPMRAAP